jgi:hypothetical protein
MAAIVGTRIRRSQQDGLVELISPNPSGGQGVYVLRWNGARALCKPTVHDALLFSQLERMTEIGPREVRDAALAVAAEGHAGRAAAAAARGVIAADRRQRLRTGFVLLQALIVQVDPTSCRTVTSRTPAFVRRAGAVLQRLAPDLRRTPAQLGAAMSAISDAFAPVGVDTSDGTARIPRLLDYMDKASTALAGRLSEDAGLDPAGIGPGVIGAFKTTQRNGLAVVDAIRTVLADPLALLTRRLTDAQGIAALTERADWLLDGWERLCHLWTTASDARSRRLALLEIAQSIPVLPHEAFEWTAPAVAVQSSDETCKITGRDIRSHSRSAVLAMIERNENLRAMSL